jgi:hypothetical protein
VKIIQSNITVNLVPYGTSMITISPKKDLILDPGSYSIDPDFIRFNTTVSVTKYGSLFSKIFHLIELGIYLLLSTL